MPPIDFPIVILFAVAILIIVAAFLSARASDREEKLLFQRMASKWNGQITWSPFYSRKLHLTRDNLTLVVYTEAGDKNARSPPRTFVVADVNIPSKYQMQVYREERIFGIGTIAGQDIRTNNPELDESFVIKGKDESIVRSILTDEVEMQLLEFKRERLRFELKRKKFKLSLGKVLENEEEYDCLINLALAIVKKAYARRGVSL